eukprot:gene17996-biopygen11979
MGIDKGQLAMHVFHMLVFDGTSCEGGRLEWKWPRRRYRKMYQLGKPAWGVAMDDVLAKRAAFKTADLNPARRKETLSTQTWSARLIWHRDNDIRLCAVLIRTRVSLPIYGASMQMILSPWADGVNCKGIPVHTLPLHRRGGGVHLPLSPTLLASQRNCPWPGLALLKHPHQPSPVRTVECIEWFLKVAHLRERFDCAMDRSSSEPMDMYAITRTATETAACITVTKSADFACAEGVAEEEPEAHAACTETLAGTRRGRGPRRT